MRLLIALLCAAVLLSAAGPVERKTCRAADGVPLIYSAAGAGEPALVFVHGGLAERSFYDAQIAAFAARHRVIALDLAGHGESGANRKKWGLPEFGDDVKAVADAENLKRMILFGNSMGGPVVMEAALLMPGRVLGVVGVDTFHALGTMGTPESARARAEAYRKDPAAWVHEMCKRLFHPDADPAVFAAGERGMQKTPPEAGYAILLSLGGYDMAAAARRLTVPLRAINGDLYPTDVPGVRKIKPDFDAVVMKHMGHYPMLERPAEFNAHVEAVVASLTR